MWLAVDFGVPSNRNPLIFSSSCDRRKICQGQKVFGFEVGALGHELLTAFVVDNLGNEVRECARSG